MARRGWHGQSGRHSLAARGMKTKCPRKSYTKSEGNPFLEKIDANWKKLNERDAEAKARGTLVGRYIQEPYADSYAVYEITKVSKNSVHIKAVKNIGDDWEIPYWGSEATIKRSYAEEKVAYRDRLRAFFEEKQKQKEAAQT